MLSWDDCFTHISGGGSISYSHNFGKGFMEFLPVSMGKAVRIGVATLCGPGVSLPDGTRVGYGSNLTTLTQLNGVRCATVQGNLPRRCIKNPTGEYVHEGSAVVPWDGTEDIDEAISPSIFSHRKWQRSGNRSPRVGMDMRGLLSAQPDLSVAPLNGSLGDSLPIDLEAGRPAPQSASRNGSTCLRVLLAFAVFILAFSLIEAGTARIIGAVHVDGIVPPPSPPPVLWPHASPFP